MVNGPIPSNDRKSEVYEMIIRTSSPKKGVKVTRVSGTQLTTAEKWEIENIRKLAVDKIRDVIGDRGFEFTFAHEMDLWPEEKTLSDKLVFRCYSDGTLVGYALVVRGWPDSSQWTIQHLILHPEHRELGFGSTIIEGIEKDALASTESVSTIRVIPIRRTSDFLRSIGYNDGGEVTIRAKGVGVATIESYCKKIR